jgi:hypothetical protein
MLLRVHSLKAQTLLAVLAMTIVEMWHNIQLSITMICIKLQTYFSGLLLNMLIW